MKKKATALLLTSALCIYVGVANACQCLEPVEIATAAERDGRIFVGRVVEERPKTSALLMWMKDKIGSLRQFFGGSPYDPINDSGFRVTFTVVENYKGDRADTTIETSGGGCRYFFDVGRTYLVWAYRKGSTPWYTDQCMRTVKLEKASGDLVFLRQRFRDNKPNAQ